MKNITRFFLLFGLFFLSFARPLEANAWKELHKRHFIVYYKAAPYDFVQTVGEMAEEYYIEIANNLGFIRFKNWNWKNRAKIYIYDDSDDFVNNAKQATWSHGVAHIQKKEIKTYPAAHGFFDSTLPHELGHIIFREFIGFEASVPLWFEEGVAMYQEKAKRWGAKADTKTAIQNGTFMDIQALTLFRPTKKSDYDKITLFYSESASIIQFLISEYGDQKFVKFCRGIRTKKSFLRSFEASYLSLKNMERLNNKWMQYIQE